MPRVRWTPYEEKRLLDLMAAGESWTLMSGMLKRSMKSVKLHAKTLRLAGKLLATARKSLPGPERNDILQEIGRFHSQITYLQGVGLKPARQGLKAKEK